MSVLETTIGDRAQGVYIPCMPRFARKPAAKSGRKPAKAAPPKKALPGKSVTVKKMVSKKKLAPKATRKTATRKTAVKSIDIGTSNARADDLTAIFERAVAYLGTKPAAQLWFERPKKRLDGLSPNEACKTPSGRSSVSQWLDEIADGAFS